MTLNRLPHITCLCPSLARPALLATSVACWANQFYDPAKISLLIGLDSDDKFTDLTTESLGDELRRYRPRARSAAKVAVERFSPELSLPAKYNAMAARAAFRWQTDVFVVWEDDDLYLPAHCNAIASRWQAVNRPESWWAHPHHVWSDYHGITQPQLEEALGRFHAALAVSRTMWERIPWINTEQADFDQQYLAALRRESRPANYENPGLRQPTYVFRWHTQHEHAQNSMTRGPSDRGWREAARRQLLASAKVRGRSLFSVGFDAGARKLLHAVGVWAQLPDSGMTKDLDQ